MQFLPAALQAASLYYPTSTLGRFVGAAVTADTNWADKPSDAKSICL